MPVINVFIDSRSKLIDGFVDGLALMSSSSPDAIESDIVKKRADRTLLLRSDFP